MEDYAGAPDGYAAPRRARPSQLSTAYAPLKDEMRYAMKQMHLALPGKLIGCSLLACLLLMTQGCNPSARDNLLVAAIQSIQSCINADDELEQALLAHVGGNMDALDLAFSADVRDLEQPDGTITYEHIEQARALYNARRVEILKSRSNIELLFCKRRRMLEETIDLIDR